MSQIFYLPYEIKELYAKELCENARGFAERVNIAKVPHICRLQTSPCSVPYTLPEYYVDDFFAVH